MRKNRIIALIVLVLVSVMCINVSAQGIQPRWTDVGTITTNLSINNGTATIGVTVRAYGHIDRVEVTAKLQEYRDGTWHTIATHTPFNNAYYLVWEENEVVSSGNNYRLRATIRAYDKLPNGNFILKETIERTHYSS